MFWRGDGDAPQAHRLRSGKQPDWPRNGAILTGFVHGDNPATAWLEVVACQQAGAKEAVPTPGCWMPFDQGGLLLHSVQ